MILHSLITFKSLNKELERSVLIKILVISPENPWRSPVEKVVYLQWENLVDGERDHNINFNLWKSAQGN